MAQEPYNLFAQQKQQYYPNAQWPQQPQPVVPGQVQGETVDQFVQGRQAANSQTGAVSQPVVTPVNTGQGGGAVMAGGTQYGQQTGGVARTTQPIRSMDDLVSAMYTDPQQEEKLRKASVANQRIMAVGDALRHIGNIFNTVNYAPSQQFNRPWEEERNRYLQEKAYRDKRNQIYMTYQQQKAVQEAKMRQAEAQNQLRSELNAAQVQYYKDRAEESARHNKEMEGLYKTKAETAAQNAQRNYEHKVETDKRRLDISQQRANRTGGGRSSRSRGGGSRTGGYKQTTTYTYDKNGKRTGSVVEKTPTGTYDQQKKPNPMGGGSNSGKKKNPMS